MFNIFTTNADGSTQLVMSASSLTQAKETACRLSLLMPGKHFAYFEKLEDVKLVMRQKNREQTRQPN